MFRLSAYLFLLPLIVFGNVMTATELAESDGANSKITDVNCADIKAIREATGIENLVFPSPKSVTIELVTEPHYEDVRSALKANPVLMLAVAPDGNVLAVVICQSSGSKEIDEMVIRLFKDVRFKAVAIKTPIAFELMPYLHRKEVDSN